MTWFEKRIIFENEAELDKILLEIYEEIYINKSAIPSKMDDAPKALFLKDMKDALIRLGYADSFHCDPVEKAEKMYKEYEPDIEEGVPCDDLIIKLYEAIQYLKNNKEIKK